jgi:hypothetical protein
MASKRRRKRRFPKKRWSFRGLRVQPEFNKPLAGSAGMPTELVLPMNELHTRALKRIADGRLPLALSTGIDAGYGAGVQCDLCDQPIAADKAEYDVTDHGSGKSLHFHRACHLAWQRECAQRLTDFPSP